MSETLPLFPLGTVLFPGLLLPLHIFEERYRQLVRDLLDGRIDLAFVGAREPNPRLRFDDFAEDEIILVASPSFLKLPRGRLDSCQKRAR